MHAENEWYRLRKQTTDENGIVTRGRLSFQETAPYDTSDDDLCRIRKSAETAAAAEGCQVVILDKNGNIVDTYPGRQMPGVIVLSTKTETKVDGMLRATKHIAIASVVMTAYSIVTFLWQLVQANSHR